MGTLNIEVAANPFIVGTELIVPRLVELINNCPAGGAINYMAYWFTDTEEYLALKGAFERGLNVKVLFDKQAAPGVHRPGYSAIATMMHNLGMDIRFDKLHSAMHCKLASISPFSLYIGSMNSTVAGDVRNAEIGLFLTGLDDPLHTAVLGLIDQVFFTHWDHAVPYS